MLNKGALSGIAVGVIGLIVCIFASMTGIGRLAAQQAPVSVPAIPAVLQSYKLVTADRLKKPEDGDWLMTRRTYDGWGYSPLSQITPDNVKALQPVWTFATGVTNGHEAPPIV